MSIDFIIDLSKSNRYMNILVIINKLLKGVILKELKNFNTETVAWTII